MSRSLTTVTLAALAYRTEGQCLLEGQAQNSENPRRLLRGTQRLTFSIGRRNNNNNTKNKQTPWPLVRERTIPTVRPPHIDEIQCQLLWIEGCRVQ
jgi:hypothetical protein